MSILLPTMHINVYNSKIWITDVCFLFTKNVLFPLGQLFHKTSVWSRSWATLQYMLICFLMKPKWDIFKTWNITWTLKEAIFFFSILHRVSTSSPTEDEVHITVIEIFLLDYMLQWIKCFACISQQLLAFCKLMLWWCWNLGSFVWWEVDYNVLFIQKMIYSADSATMGSRQTLLQ